MSLAAFRERGGFLLEDAEVGALAPAVLEASRAFFALPRPEKEALAIERSPHFRGWSEMRNERDWREQIHLGRELPPGRGHVWSPLEGPNLWPGSPGWRAILERYMDAAARAGERVLASIWPSVFDGIAAGGYRLTKIIGYHSHGGTPRPGVAAHVDFSFITLTLQDSAGLEVRRPDGRWVPVPAPGLWVHPGELLEHATRGQVAATPHRVLNPSADRLRISLPTFMNPPLEGRVSRIVQAPGPPSRDEEHVHRVLGPETPDAFVFGEAEWRRKGLGRWCRSCTAT